MATGTSWKLLATLQAAHCAWLGDAWHDAQPVTESRQVSVLGHVLSELAGTVSQVTLQGMGTGVLR